MKIIVIGAGFTGLAAGIKLRELGHEVILLESADKPGGLATGFKAKGWDWNLENYYHHIFTNDHEIISLAQKVGLPPFFQIPETCIYRNGRISKLDDPVSLLTNRELSLYGRLHMAAGLALLKLTPAFIAKGFEQTTATKLLPYLVGREGYHKVWEPLLNAKFGPFVNDVNLAWFWARVAKRSQSLGYFKGGFQALADAMLTYYEKIGGKVFFNQPVGKIKYAKSQITFGKYQVDAALLTVPAPLVNKIAGPVVVWPKINYLWAQTLVLELASSLMKPYWLNILEPDWPFLVAVEHTNFIDKKHYGKRRLLYLGNYLSATDKRLKLNQKQLLKLYLPFLKLINPGFSAKQIVTCHLFKSPYAQPVFPTYYSNILPTIVTQNPKVFVANMSMVYPFDRGTNYAVKLGQEAADLISKRCG